MNKKHTVLIIISAVLIAALIAAVIVRSYTKSRKARDAEGQAQLLAYISEQSGEEFSFAQAESALQLTRKELHRYLLALETAGKIKPEQKHLRKPILITDSDYENYYWKIHVTQ